MKSAYTPLKKLVSCLAWRVNLSETALKQLRKLDPPIAKRIRAELVELKTLTDPRSRGKALTGNQRGYWRYRVGDYRIICLIEDEELIILALKIGHRSKIY